MIYKMKCGRRSSAVVYCSPGKLVSEKIIGLSPKEEKEAT